MHSPTTLGTSSVSALPLNTSTTTLAPVRPTPGTPLDCMATCATCTSGTTCATCINTQFTLNTANNLCECPAKKYVSGTDCLGNLPHPYLLDCLDTCATCTDATTCATCPTDFELDSTTNTCKCVATKYLTGSTCSGNLSELTPCSLPRKLRNLHGRIDLYYLPQRAHGTEQRHEPLRVEL